MVPYRVIRRKRDGETIAREELTEFFRAYESKRVSDYQMAAFLMAVYHHGMDATELDALVGVMLASGRTLRWNGAGRRVDKHSTGGVGDKVSLVLAPLVAALGVQVPMMSGRGLGHSGGTVDKLESISGLRLDLSLDAFQKQVTELGLGLISQTSEIAPLDKRLYALRDVTATVESIPLIASSIMSKKIAEGVDGLVLDVKVGNGAFIPDEGRALELARTMIGIGREQGLDVVALLTAMDRPLGRAVGNALEVAEAVETLRGGGPRDLRRVTLALAAEMLVLGGAAEDLADAREQAAAALDDGSALDRFRLVVAAQGGDASMIDDPGRLPSAPVRFDVTAERGGTVRSVDTRAVGEAAVALGAGRRSMEDPIDPRVGFVLAVEPGQTIDRGDRLAVVHAAEDAAAERAAEALRAAYEIGDGASTARPLLSHRISAAGIETLD